MKRNIARIDLGEYNFQNDMIRLPSGLEHVAINPSGFHLRFEERNERQVPVQVRTIGEPARGYQVASIVAEPAEVKVRGAKTAVNSIAA